METSEMDGMATALRSSLTDSSIVVAVYERLYHLPPPSLVAGWLRLPGIVFPLADVSPVSECGLDSDLHVYRATSSMLGNVEIKTTTELFGMEGLPLIHCWISPLLDRDFSSSASHITCTLRPLVRLRQPFGPLLLAPPARVQYRWVATDSLVMVWVREETSLTELMDGTASARSPYSRCTGWVNLDVLLHLTFATFEYLLYLSVFWPAPGNFTRILQPYASRLHPGSLPSLHQNFWFSGSRSQI